MKNGKCCEQLGSRETERAGKSPKEDTLVSDMCMVQTWQGPRNQASWNRLVKEGKLWAMGACTPGRTRKDSNAWETVVGVAAAVAAVAAVAVAVAAERGPAGHRTPHERNEDGAAEGSDQEACLRHRMDRLRGRLPLIGGAPEACWGWDLGETAGRN